MKRIAFLLVIAPSLSFGQISKQDSIWFPLKFMIGTWTGTYESAQGKGTYECSYALTRNKKFIEVINKVTYPPSKAKPEGEVREDHGFISYDRVRRVYVFRQFDNEGLVKKYKIQSISPDGQTVVFASENIESIPFLALRAKVTYNIIDQNAFSRVSERAKAGKEFEWYSNAVLKRSK